MKKYRHAVSALVLRPSGVCTADGCGKINSVLLVHKPRNKDSWQLPQGGIEEGETEEQAALRELMEEAGVKAEQVSLKSTQTYCYDFPADFVRRYNPVNAGQKLCFVVIEVPEGTKVKVDEREVDSHVWALPEQLSQYITRKEYLDVIERVLEEYEKA